MNTETTATDGTATKTVSIYDLQAQDFANKHSIKLKCKHLKFGKYFAGDTDNRHIFKCTISRLHKQYTFNFGQSINAGSTAPSMYDVLTCLEKYEVETFEDFCSSYGYDTDSRTAEKIYKAVVKEYKEMLRVFGEDILEEMQEIQ